MNKIKESTGDIIEPGGGGRGEGVEKLDKIILICEAAGLV